MIRHMGASGIASAVGVSSETVRRWRRAQLRGEESPLTIRTTKTGGLWCGESDVEQFFAGPQTAGEKVQAEAEQILQRLGFA